MLSDAPPIDLKIRTTPGSFILEVRGRLEAASLTAFTVALEEIEAERYARVVVDLSSVERVEIAAARELAIHQGRALARDLSVQTVPPLSALYLDALLSTVREASVGRRALIEIHRRLMIDPRGVPRDEVVAWAAEPQRLLRETARAIVGAVVDLKADPVLLRSRHGDPGRRAWRGLWRTAGAAGRADQELQACFVELAAAHRRVRPASERVLDSLAESIAADDAMRALASERLNELEPAR